MKIFSEVGDLRKVLLLNFAVCVLYLLLCTAVVGKTVTTTMTETRHVNLEVKVSPGVQPDKDSAEREEYNLFPFMTQAPQPTMDTHHQKQLQRHKHEHQFYPAMFYTPHKLKPSTSNFGYVRIFRQKNFQEDSQALRIDESQCVNLPYEWENRVTSIDTLGLCVLLWELEDCSGRHRVITGDDDNDNSDVNLPTSRKHTSFFNSIELC